MEKISARDILITTVPPWGLENPPLGLAFLSEYLRAKGVEVEVVDFNLCSYQDLGPEYRMLWHVENKNYWSYPDTFSIILKILEEEIDSFVQAISSSPARMVGFSVVDPKERLTIEIIKRVRKQSPDKKIVLGGPACSTEEQRRIFIQSVPKDIDAMVVGEGEETLFELVDRLKKRKSLQGTPGALTRVRGQWKFVSRSRFPSLDSIPYPTYQGFKLHQYLGRTLLVEWSRGCIGQCSFCKNWRLVRGYRCRSAPHIMEELIYHYQKNRVSEFTVCDPVLNGNPGTLKEICEHIIHSGYRFRWSGELTPSSRMPRTLFTLMREAGCFKLQIGVESGSDRVLRLMQKIYTVRDAENTIRNARKAGITTEIFLLIGYPGERDEDFKMTTQFIKRNRKYIHTIKSIDTLHLIAGTDLYEKPRDYGILPLPEKDWHYMWKTADGNDYSLRSQRARQILDLARDLGIEVRETNLSEGKEQDFSLQDLSRGWEGVRANVNILQRLKIKPKKKRSLFRFVYILSMLLATLLADLYLWILKKVRRTVVFPGG